MRTKFIRFVDALATSETRFLRIFIFINKQLETGFLAPRDSALKLSEVLINDDLLTIFFGENEPRRREGGEEREEREGEEFRMDLGLLEARLQAGICC